MSSVVTTDSQCSGDGGARWAVSAPRECYCEAEPAVSQSVSRSADLLQGPLTVQPDSRVYFSLEQQQDTKDTRHKTQDKNIYRSTQALLSSTLNVELIHQPEMFADLMNDALGCYEPVISEDNWAT